MRRVGEVTIAAYESARKDVEATVSAQTGGACVRTGGPAFSVTTPRARTIATGTGNASE